jgi:serine/threonine protein phosphatase PrpC
MTGAVRGRPLRGSTLHVRSGHATDVGRVRGHNEDSLLDDGPVFAVADGLGGHAAGEVASRLAVEALAALVAEPATRPEDVASVLHDANARILSSEREHPQQQGMGTTVTGLTLADTGDREQWVVFNIGDSRVYRLAEHRLEQVTRDHSEVRELVDAGLLDPSEAARHPLRNVITRSLGRDPAPDPDVWVLTPSAGERFLVCSDGLTNELDDREILQLLSEHPDPQSAADELVGAALRAGGRDNVSVVVVVVEDAEDPADGGEDDDADTAPRAGLARP